MLWPAIGRRYVETFTRACTEHESRLRTVFETKTIAEQPSEFPEVNLGHLKLLTDETGVLQHAAFGVPRYHDGYCLDDNARALLLMTLVEDAATIDAAEARALASRYLAFVTYAFNDDRRRFRNFLSYSRQWSEPQGSEDSHARALWALGTVVGRAVDPGRQSLSSNLFHAALPAVEAFTSPRGWAYTLLGINEYLRAFEGDRGVQAVRKMLAHRLFGLWERSSSPDWPWFEPRATYCNPRLSQALIVSGAGKGDEAMTAAGLKSLEWLCAVQRSKDGYFSPIGSEGFYARGGVKAEFDQQPVEACAMVSACIDAAQVTGDATWLLQARGAFNWMLGENQLQQSLYEPATGGCRDGLQPDRLNPNQGAESTLSFLLALCEMQAASQPESARRVRRETKP
jgi:hypothetical protein